DGNGVIDGMDSKLVATNSGNMFPAEVSSDTTRTVSYGYDEDGRVKRLYVPEDPVYDYTQDYDGMGRLQYISQNSYLAYEYAYDKASNVTRRLHHYANNASINYTYDKLSRITDLQITKENPAQSLFYEHYTYTEMNRIDSL